MSEVGRRARVVRAGSSALLLVAGVLLAGPSRADVEACVALHERGQNERNSGQLLGAQADFVSCASADCPALVRAECQQFLAQVKAQLASVVFAASDASGKAETAVEVVVDGQRVLERLTGASTVLDPGQHSVVYTWPDGHQQQEPLVLEIGERNALFVMRREPRPKAAPTSAASSARPVPTLAYVLGGVGVAALGVFGGFALAGKSTQSELDRCKPNCTRDGVDRMRQRYLIADIALGVGLLSLGAGTYVYFNAEPAQSDAPREARLGFGGTF